MAILVPIGVAVFAWWLTTVVALYRIGLPSSSYRQTFLMGSLLAGVGIFMTVATLSDTSVTAAYLGFGGALALWGWHELSYYLGYVTGPEPVACPPGCSMRERFVRGVRASLYHELAIVLTVILLFAVCWRADNPMALNTFCVLWLMRWSAKLNIFLGARNVHMEFLPRHLQYLSTYMTKRSMNVLFPVSMLLAGWVLSVLVSRALTPTASSYEVTSSVLLATLLGLAMLEHVLLMLKIPDAVLWRLGTSSRGAGSA